MDLNGLLKDNPQFHEFRGQLISGWRLDERTLRFLDEHLHAHMKTIETGSGISTVLFALKGTSHTCVVPDEKQVERIAAYCEAKKIALTQLRFLLERSELALPGVGETDYDLALIDGRHGFPTPFIDWFYMSRMLKIGGVVIIDDLHIWTCDLLRKFLLSEPEDWESLDETNRAAIFRKRGNIASGREWSQQPFVLQRSAAHSLSARLGQAADHIAHRKSHLVLSLMVPRVSSRLWQIRRLASWRWNRLLQRLRNASE